MRRLFLHMSAILFMSISLLIALRGDRTAGADPENNEIFLDYHKALSFTPEQAFFLVDYDGKRAERLPAPILQLVGENGGANTQSVQEWGTAVRIPIAQGISRVSYAVIFAGSGNLYSVSPLISTEVNAEALFGGAIDQLRQHLLDRKTQLASWKLQIDEQAESLRRLRSDAEVIGNLGRLQERSEELNALLRAIQDNAADMTNLRRLLALSRSSPAPKNTVGRTAQLTKQVAELAEAAKRAESEESKRRVNAEGDLHHKLQIIEATRTEDLDALKHELEWLNRRRSELEVQL